MIAFHEVPSEFQCAECASQIKGLILEECKKYTLMLEYNYWMLISEFFMEGSDPWKLYFGTTATILFSVYLIYNI